MKIRIFVVFAVLFGVGTNGTSLQGRRKVDLLQGNSGDHRNNGTNGENGNRGNGRGTERRVNPHIEHPRHDILGFPVEKNTESVQQGRSQREIAGNVDRSNDYGQSLSMTYRLMKSEGYIINTDDEVSILEIDCSVENQLLLVVDLLSEDSVNPEEWQPGDFVVLSDDWECAFSDGEPTAVLRQIDDIEISNLQGNHVVEVLLETTDVTLNDIYGQGEIHVDYKPVPEDKLKLLERAKYSNTSNPRQLLEINRNAWLSGVSDQIVNNLKCIDCKLGFDPQIRVDYGWDGGLTWFNANASGSVTAEARLGVTSSVTFSGSKKLVDKKDFGGFYIPGTIIWVYIKGSIIFDYNLNVSGSIAKGPGFSYSKTITGGIEKRESDGTWHLIKTVTSGATFLEPEIEGNINFGAKFGLKAVLHFSLIANAVAADVYAHPSVDLDLDLKTSGSCKVEGSADVDLTIGGEVFVASQSVYKPNPYKLDLWSANKCFVS